MPGILLKIDMSPIWKIWDHKEGRVVIYYYNSTLYLNIQNKGINWNYLHYIILGIAKFNNRLREEKNSYHSKTIRLSGTTLVKRS